MAASSKLTEYERKRLENICRNGELMASLKLHSMATQLSASTKRQKDETTKSSKVSSQKKPKTDQTPIVVRRSLRTRGMPPDSEGLPSDLLDSPLKNRRSKSSSPTKPSPRKLGPLSMREAYIGEGSHRTLLETLKRVEKESEVNESLGAKIGGVRICKGEILSDSVKKEEDNEVGGSFDLCSKVIPENIRARFGGDRVCKVDNLSDLVKKEDNEVGFSSDLFPKSNSENIGEKFRGDRVCKGEILTASVKKDSEVGGCFDVHSMNSNAENVGAKSGGVRICKDENLSDSIKKEENEVGGYFDFYSMTLNPRNIARILPDRIMHARFFPCASSRVIVAGNKLGDVGFWNLDPQRDDEETEDGIYTYHSHSGPVSGISIHQHCLSKVSTSCYDGFVRLMDAEKEVFNLIYSSEYSIFSLSQRSNDPKCLYFGEACGLLNIWDERMGKCSTQSVLHADRINSIDFNSGNPNILATSSSDGNVCIWDLRSIDANKTKALKTISHKRSVHSAYFSPSGKCLATTRAIWGWDDSYVFIGNMKRGVDVISPSQSRTIFTLQSPHLSAIPCRFDAHPYNVGMLAGATGGGQLGLKLSKTVCVDDCHNRLTGRHPRGTFILAFYSPT
ncbi:WD repeat-containing protein 76 [Morus notabilis]|uniref:WD repeat-containing protein 76 n=1 Tax=Morus notabilis TaxID=981085 RepID=W9RDF0_9ROSA|nr:WD repeat-containing protein 76 [Morus notabilis]